MTVLTREQITTLVGIFVIVASALWPPLQPYLEVIAPSVVGLLAILLGIPAVERAVVQVAQARAEAYRLQLAIQEQRVTGKE